MSTLSVDNIIEKTSGAGVKIPGHVVQTVEYNAYPSYIEVSSNNFTASNMQVDITPKFNTK